MTRFKYLQYHDVASCYLSYADSAMLIEGVRNIKLSIRCIMKQ